MLFGSCRRQYVRHDLGYNHAVQGHYCVKDMDRVWKRIYFLQRYLYCFYYRYLQIERRCDDQWHDLPHSWTFRNLQISKRTTIEEIRWWFFFIFIFEICHKLENFSVIKSEMTVPESNIDSQGYGTGMVFHHPGGSMVGESHYPEYL